MKKDLNNLINYPEDDDENDAEEPKKEASISIGIDFGTSTMSVAIWDKKSKAPKLVSDPHNKYRTSFPTVAILKAWSKNPSEKKLSSIGKMINEGDNQFQSVEDKISYTNNEKQFTSNTKINNIKRIIGQKFSSPDLKTKAINLPYLIIEDTDSQTGKDEHCLDQRDSSLSSKGKYKTLKRKTPERSDKIKIKIDDFIFTPEEICAQLLMELIKYAEETFNEKVGTAVISSPHSFSNSQRQALKDACVIAGIKNAHVINETTATALYYGSLNKIMNLEYSMIIDFGAGKIDIAVISIEHCNIIKVLGVNGDNNLGGEEINILLYRYITEKVKEMCGKKIKKNSNESNFIIKSLENIKTALTFKTQTEITIPKIDGEKDWQLTIARDELEEQWKLVCDRLKVLIESVLSSANVKKENLSNIIIVGETFKIPKLWDFIQTGFEGLQIITDLDNSVAFGAAIQAAKWANLVNVAQIQKTKIYDITPLSLGIRVQGDLMAVIIPRGSRMPIKAMKQFVTTEDYQTVIKFEVYEGERKLVKDNKWLGKWVLRDLPDCLKGEVKVDVYFSIDHDGILQITASENGKDNVKEVQITENGNWSIEEVNSWLHQAEDNKVLDNEEEIRIKAQLKLNDSIVECEHSFSQDEDLRRKIEEMRNWWKHNLEARKEEYENKEHELLSWMPNEENEEKLSEMS